MRPSATFSPRGGAKGDRPFSLREGTRHESLMARSFPPDVVVLDTDSLVHARLGRGRTNPRILNAKSYRLAADTFTASAVSPALANEAALGETLRRLRAETGKWEKVSILLPDS